jgi:transposase
LGGRPRRDDRLIVAGIWYVLRTGCPWRDLPACYGRWGGVYTRWRRWCLNQLWGRILKCLRRYAVGQLRFVDCSHIKLHQDGANGCGGHRAQAIGRTKGGLNTKLAMAVDAHGRVVALGLAPGSQHDQRAVEPLLPSLRGKRFVGDKGFDADTFAARLRGLRIRVCIPARKQRRRPLPFHRGYYRQRHHVENGFGRLKRFRRVGTRYEKLALTFLGFVQLAAIFDWLSHQV